MLALEALVWRNRSRIWTYGGIIGRGDVSSPDGRVAPHVLPDDEEEKGDVVREDCKSKLR